MNCKTWTIRFALVVLLTAGVAASMGQSRRRRITDPRDATAQERRSYEPIGYRPPVGQRQRVDSQLYVTGQVSGLAGFRGDVPYGAPDAFRDTTGGADLSSFRRQSVGLPDVLSGRVHGPAVFRDPETTVPTVGRIMDRDAARRSRADGDRMLPRSLADELFVDATAAYEPIAPVGRETRREQWTVRPVRDEFRPEPFADDVRPLTVPAGAGALFGLLRDDHRGELVRQLQETGPDGFERSVAARVEARVDGRPGAVAPPEQGRFIRPPDDPDEMEPADAAGAYLLPPPGEDVYLDLLVTMRDRRIAEDVEESPRAVRDAETLHRRRRDPQTDTDAPLVEWRPGRPVIVRGLAGQGEDLFNRHMHQGQQRLRDGAFYEARQSFEMARVIDPANPLASVGQALASFGAGEAASAGYHMHRAMRTFPPIMETQFDLTTMMPEERIDPMLSELDQRLRGRAEDTQLLLLATFLRHNLGRGQEAQELARRLRDAADDDDVAAAYGEYVLTGRRPADGDE